MNDLRTRNPVVKVFFLLAALTCPGVAQSIGLLGHPVYSGMITPYEKATAMDSSQRPSRNAMFDGFSGEKSLSDQSPRFLQGYKPSFKRTDPVSLGLADTVVEGTVVGTSSWLSNDHTTIYTENLVKIDAVLLDSVHTSIGIGATIAVERAGGLVRFPSGITIQRGAQGQSLPMNGYRYLFSLKYSSTASAFNIVSALALVGGRTFILEDVSGGTNGVPLTLGVYPMSPEKLVSSVTSTIASNSKNK